MEGWNVLSPLWRFQSAVFELIADDLARYRLHAKSLAVLEALTENQYPNEVSRALRVPMPTLSNILRELERSGYIRREVDEIDRRRVIIRRTRDGEEALKHCVRVVDRAVVQKLNEMDSRVSDHLRETASLIGGSLARTSGKLDKGIQEPEVARLH